MLLSFLKLLFVFCSYTLIGGNHKQQEAIGNESFISKVSSFLQSWNNYV